MQPARDLVAAVAELAARMKDRERERHSRDLLFRVQVNGEPTAVVRDPDPVAGEQFDRDGVAVTRQRLVDGVVDDLVHEVVETPFARGADVHAGSFADGLEPLQHRDGTCVVGTVGHSGGRGPRCAGFIGFSCHWRRTPCKTTPPV